MASKGSFANPGFIFLALAAGDRTSAQLEAEKSAVDERKRESVSQGRRLPPETHHTHRRHHSLPSISLGATRIRRSDRCLQRYSNDSFDPVTSKKEIRQFDAWSTQTLSQSISGSPWSRPSYAPHQRVLRLRSPMASVRIQQRRPPPSATKVHFDPHNEWTDISCDDEEDQASGTGNAAQARCMRPVQTRKATGFVREDVRDQRELRQKMSDVAASLPSHSAGNEASSRSRQHRDEFRPRRQMTMAEDGEAGSHHGQHRRGPSETKQKANSMDVVRDAHDAGPENASTVSANPSAEDTKKNAGRGIGLRFAGAMLRSMKGHGPHKGDNDPSSTAGSGGDLVLKCAGSAEDINGAVTGGGASNMDALMAANKMMSAPSMTEAFAPVFCDATSLFLPSHTYNSHKDQNFHNNMASLPKGKSAFAAIVESAVNAKIVETKHKGDGKVPAEGHEWFRFRSKAHGHRHEENNPTTPEEAATADLSAASRQRLHLLAHRAKMRVQQKAENQAGETREPCSNGQAGEIRSVLKKKSSRRLSRYVPESEPLNQPNKNEKAYQPARRCVKETVRTDGSQAIENDEQEQNEPTYVRGWQRDLSEDDQSDFKHGQDGGNAFTMELRNADQDEVIWIGRDGQQIVKPRAHKSSKKTREPHDKTDRSHRVRGSERQRAMTQDVSDIVVAAQASLADQNGDVYVTSNGEPRRHHHHHHQAEGIDRTVERGDSPQLQMHRHHHRHHNHQSHAHDPNGGNSSGEKHARRRSRSHHPNEIVLNDDARCRHQQQSQNRETRGTQQVGRPGRQRYNSIADEKLLSSSPPRMSHEGVSCGDERDANGVQGVQRKQSHSFLRRPWTGKKKSLMNDEDLDDEDSQAPPLPTTEMHQSGKRRGKVVDAQEETRLGLALDMARERMEQELNEVKAEQKRMTMKVNGNGPAYANGNGAPSMADIMPPSRGIGKSGLQLMRKTKKTVARQLGLGGDPKPRPDGAPREAAADGMYDDDFDGALPDPDLSPSRERAYLDEAYEQAVQHEIETKRQQIRRTRLINQGAAMSMNGPW